MSRHVWIYAIAPPLAARWCRAGRPAGGGPRETRATVE